LLEVLRPNEPPGSSPDESGLTVQVLTRRGIWALTTVFVIGVVAKMFLILIGEIPPSSLEYPMSRISYASLALRELIAPVLIYLVGLFAILLIDACKRHHQNPPPDNRGLENVDARRDDVTTPKSQQDRETEEPQ